jgi:hypothetical protein
MATKAERKNLRREIRDHRQNNIMTRTVSVGYIRHYFHHCNQLANVHEELKTPIVRRKRRCNPRGYRTQQYLDIEEEAEEQYEAWARHIPLLPGDGLGEPAIPLTQGKNFISHVEVQTGGQINYYSPQGEKE